MFSVGMPELILVFVVALLVFGPKKLPEVGRMLGKAMREFKKAADDFKEAINQQPPEEIVKEVEQKLKENKEKEEAEKAKLDGSDKNTQETDIYAENQNQGDISG